ncbi:MAG: hypothetical protein GY835_25290 [bacterium]|nr:hypothetical protein [bacterium]
MVATIRPDLNAVISNNGIAKNRISLRLGAIPSRRPTVSGLDAAMTLIAGEIGDIS